MLEQKETELSSTGLDCELWRRLRLSLNWELSCSWTGLGHAPRNVSANRGCNARCLSHLITVFNECPLRPCVALCRAVCGILWHVVYSKLRHLHARLPSPKKSKAVPTWLQFLLFLGSQKILYSHSNCNVPRVPRCLSSLPACLTHALSSGAGTSRCFAACNMQHVGCNLLVLPLSFFFRFSCSADDADLGRAPTASSSSRSS